MHILRKWQEDAKTIIQDAINSPNHECVPINACVGSGKTNVAWEGIIDFIEAHPNEKTIHLFVTPRIRLCKQQKQDFSEYYYRRKGVEPLNDGIYPQEKNCEAGQPKLYEIVGQNQGTVASETDTTSTKYRHFVIFIVDESLWGVSKKQGADNKEVPIRRFENETLKALNKWAEDGYTFGIIAYDESHNYQNNQDYMFGEELYFSVENNQGEFDAENC